MTDRELLEMAARAAGIDGVYESWAGQGFMEGIRRKGNPKEFKIWNPLIYDDQALRLYCALPWLSLETSDLAATVLERGKPDEPSRVRLMWTEWLDKHNGDLSSATRRAIVRAAAAIGSKHE